MRPVTAATRVRLVSDRLGSATVPERQFGSSTLSAAQSRPSLEGKTVVIADDDPTIVEYLELRCRHLGLKVEGAYDGIHAVLKVGKVISVCPTSRASGSWSG
jgi:PleD family two-component response regulator